MAEPVLSAGFSDLAGIKYTLHHTDKFVDVESDNIEGVHLHDFFEIYINLEGDVSFFVKNHIYPISRGDIIFTRPNELHYCIYKKSCTHNLFCLWFSEGDLYPQKLFENCSNYISPDLSVKEDLISSFFSLQEAKEKGDILESTAQFMKILSIIKKEAEISHKPQTPSAPPQFQEILDYINLHYGEITNISELYPRFFTSPSTLRRWFIKYANMSPKNYLEYIKLSNAKQFLSKEMSVTDTCYACGYSDCSHFINIFKKNFGVTPLQYKNEKK